MSDQNQPRTPAGVPTGGQFAASAHAESGVRLASYPGVAGLPPDIVPAEAKPVLVGALRVGDFVSLDGDIVEVTSVDGDHKSTSIEFDHDPDTIASYTHNETLDRIDPAEPVAAYDSGAASTRHDVDLATEGLDRLPYEAQESRRTAVADHFAEVALQAAARLDGTDIPNPGRPVLTRDYGVLTTAAEACVEQRIASVGGAPSHLAVEAAADALVEKMLDTRDFIAANGVPFRARIVRKGAFWGRDGGLVAQEDTVFFFDARYPDHEPMIGYATEDRAKHERNGQYIGSYHASTLRAHRSAGLNLDTGVDDWSIDAETFGEVLNWLDRRAPLRQNFFADCADTHSLVTSLEPTRRRLAHGETGDIAGISRRLGKVDEAYAVRERELARGWESLDAWGTPGWTRSQREPDPRCSR